MILLYVHEPSRRQVWNGMAPLIQRPKDWSEHSHVRSSTPSEILACGPLANGRSVSTERALPERSGGFRW